MCIRDRILTTGDADVYSHWYQQQVERFRTDVTVFGANFLASPWYREYFGGRHDFARAFPFQDEIPRGKEAFDALVADGVLKPQLASGRAVYAVYADPVFTPFQPKVVAPLLAPEDYDVPEADFTRDAPDIFYRDPMGRYALVYRAVSEGGVIPAYLDTAAGKWRPSVLWRLSLPAPPDAASGS